MGRDTLFKAMVTLGKAFGAMGRDLSGLKIQLSYHFQILLLLRVS